MKTKNPSLFAGILFFFSGAGSLIVQVAWIKSFSLQMGSAAWSISAVVAAFMMGLGLGGWWSGRNVKNWKRAFLVFGFLELGVATCDFLSVPVLANLDLLYGPLYRALSGQFYVFVFFQLIFVFILLFIPTVLMGASLPLLVVGLSKYKGFDKTMGLFYGINTMGASAGVIATGFFLLPTFGIKKTIIIAGLIELAVGLLAFTWNHFAAAEEHPPKLETPKKVYKAPYPLLFISFVGGAISLFYEVCWTRLLSPVLGSSTYAFSIILFIFLVGIGLGSFIASRKAVTESDYKTNIIYLMMGIALFVVGGLHVVNHMPAIFYRLASFVGDKTWLLFVSQGMVVACLFFIPTLLMGILLPVTIFGCHTESGNEGQSIGGVYLFNTIGSIVGSLLAGYIFIQVFGSYRAIFIAVWVQIFAVFIFTFWTRSINLIGKKYMLANAIPIIILALTVPPLDTANINFGVFEGILDSNQGKYSKATRAPIFVKDGLNTTVSVFRNPTTTNLRTNGQPQADSFYGTIPQYMLAHIPMFLHPNPKNVAIIGLGSGATTRAAASHPVDQIDVVELEPAVVDATVYFSNIVDNLDDFPKVKIHIEDGRTFLKYAPKKYDVIISQPSHPWTVGVGSLFSLDFYEIVKQRMTSGAILCQWVQGYNFSQDTLNAMFQTINKSFNYVAIFDYADELFLVATDEPLKASIAEIESRFKHEDIQFLLDRMGFESIYNVFSNYVGSFPEDLKLYPSVNINTDDNLYLEYQAPFEMYAGLNPSIVRLPRETLLKRIFEKFYRGGSRDSVAIGFMEGLILRPTGGTYFTTVSNLTSSPETVKRIDLARRRYLINKDMPVILEKVDSMMRDKNFNLALDKLSKIEKYEKRNPVVFKYLGNIYRFKEDYINSVEYFEKALELYPFNYEVIRSLAQVKMLQGKFNEAEALLIQAVDIYPGDLQSNAHLLAFWRIQGKDREISEFVDNKARIISAEDLETLNGLAKSLVETEFYNSLKI